jgi:hypothetical protein
MKVLQGFIYSFCACCAWNCHQIVLRTLMVPAMFGENHHNYSTYILKQGLLIRVWQ